MTGTESKPEICRSYFMNGEQVTTRERFTKKWAEMINTIEKAKAQGAGQVNIDHNDELLSV